VVNDDPGPVLGELLRHLAELVDSGSAARYHALGLDYRPRYTPVMRALAAGAETVTEITARSRITQGAVSQTLRLMLDDGLVERYAMTDARRSGLRMTPAGEALLARLEACWASTSDAIADLEAEIGHPLRRALDDATRALESTGFAERLARAGENGSDPAGDPRTR